MKKAIQITHSQQLNIIEVEDPQAPGPGEILLKLHYVGFCGSDINTFMGRNSMALDPVIPGHEVGAVIEAVGSGVPEGLKPGMVVTCNPYTNCGKCASCRNQRVNACQHNETLGVQRNGAMREYITLPWEKVIPAGLLTPKVCALVEPMSVGFHAVSRAQVTDIDVVLVIGCGMVGMGAVVRSVMRGATVVAADIDDGKLAQARKMGASYTINTRTENVHQRLMEMTSGFGPDVRLWAVHPPIRWPSTRWPSRVEWCASAMLRPRCRSRRSSLSRRSLTSVAPATPSRQTSVLSFTISKE